MLRRLLQHLLQQRSQVGGRIIPHRPGAGHHELRFLHDFAAGIANEKAVGDLGNDQAANPE